MTIFYTWNIKLYKLVVDVHIAFASVPYFLFPSHSNFDPPGKEVIGKLLKTGKPLLAADG